MTGTSRGGVRSRAAPPLARTCSQRADLGDTSGHERGQLARAFESRMGLFVSLDYARSRIGTRVRRARCVLCAQAVLTRCSLSVRILERLCRGRSGQKDERRALVFAMPTSSSGEGLGVARQRPPCECRLVTKSKWCGVAASLVAVTLAGCGGGSEPSGMYKAADAERLANVAPRTPGWPPWPQKPEPKKPSSGESPEEIAARDPIYAEYRRRTADIEQRGRLGLVQQVGRRRQARKPRRRSLRYRCRRPRGIPGLQRPLTRIRREVRIRGEGGEGRRARRRGMASLGALDTAEK